MFLKKRQQLREQTHGYSLALLPAILMSEPDRDVDLSEAFHDLTGFVLDDDLSVSALNWPLRAVLRRNAKEYLIAFRYGCLA